MKQQYKMHTSRCVKGRMIRWRQLDPRFSAFDSGKLVQQFNGYCLGVELHSTVFSSVPGPMSSYTRQSFRTRPDVELHSTALYAVPDPLSSYTRQPFCTRSNAESHSTALSSVQGPMSSYTRQPFSTRSNVELHSTALLYQVQCRVTLDSPFFCTRSSVESHSTALSFLPGPLSSPNRHVIWCTMFYILLSSCDLMAAFEIRILIDFLEKFGPDCRS
jgi:hypothetical protein